MKRTRPQRTPTASCGTLPARTIGGSATGGAADDNDDVEALGVHIVGTAGVTVAVAVVVAGAVR